MPVVHPVLSRRSGGATGWRLRWVFTLMIVVSVVVVVLEVKSMLEGRGRGRVPVVSPGGNQGSEGENAEDWEPWLTPQLEVDEIRKITSREGCAYLKTARCETDTMTVFGGRLVTGGRPYLIKPILANTTSNGVRNTILLRSCESPEIYVSQVGCAVELSSVVRTAYTLRKSYYKEGSIRVEVADWPMHFVRTERGFLIVQGEDENGDKVEHRQDGEWELVPYDAEHEKRFEDRVEEGGRTVFLERKPSLEPAKDKFNKGETCDVSFHGCCNPKKRSDPIEFDETRPGSFSSQPKTLAVAISSARTLPSRVPILKNWFAHPLFTSKVISLDCDVSLDVRSAFSSLTPTFLVGPQGPPVPGMSEVTLRVPMVLHWCFTNDSPDWFFIVDDDTLVFPDAMSWVLSWLGDPGDVIYAGHTSEWLEKTKYHGDMAFGGGGVLVSRGAGRVWQDFFNTPDPKIAAVKWLQSGKCSHSGGDGSFCRCLDWAFTSLIRPEVQDGYFVDVRGFHQFDVVGTHNIRKIIQCPQCPDPVELTLPWVADVMGSQPIVTLHHLLAVSPGSVLPGQNGTATGELFLSVSSTLPPLTLLRRKCFSASKSPFTICLNPGYLIQLFPLDVPPSSAVILLDRHSNSETAQNPQEKLTSVAVTPHLPLVRCTAFYRKFSNGLHSYDGYPGEEPRPKFAPECRGTFEVDHVKGVFKGEFFTVDGRKQAVHEVIPQEIPDVKPGDI